MTDDSVAGSSRHRYRRRIIFFGRVQGVGFRYTAASLAKHFDVNGYVRNLSDGSVELVAEGSPQNVERLLAGLAGRFSIDRQEPRDASADEPLDDFQIRP